MQNKIKMPFVKFIDLLIKKSKNMYSYIGFFIFIITVGAKFVKIENLQMQNIVQVISNFPVPIFFIIIFYSSYKVWLDEKKEDPYKVKLSLLPKKIFSLSSWGSWHPDSKGLFTFDLNISCETPSDITINAFKLEGEEPLYLFYSKRYKTKLLDCQNSYFEFYLPKMIKKSASEQFSVEFLFEPIPFKKDESHNQDVPKHILEFASSLINAKNFQLTLVVVYTHQGNMLEEKISALVEFSDLKNHFKKQWTESGWLQAVKLIDT